MFAGDCFWNKTWEYANIKGGGSNNVGPHLIVPLENKEHSVTLLCSLL